MGKSARSSRVAVMGKKEHTEEVSPKTTEGECRKVTMTTRKPGPFKKCCFIFYFLSFFETTDKPAM